MTRRASGLPISYNAWLLCSKISMVYLERENSLGPLELESDVTATPVLFHCPKKHTSTISSSVSTCKMPLLSLLLSPPALSLAKNNVRQHLTTIHITAS